MSSFSSIGNVLNPVSLDPLIKTLDSVVSFDSYQDLTEEQAGTVRSSIKGWELGGFRNKIINGEFLYWQRAASQTSSGYGSVDRWANIHIGSTKTTSRQNFGNGDLPFEDQYYVRTVVSTVAGTGNMVRMNQAVEGVRSLAGKKATITFWARTVGADKPMSVELTQVFGTGGTPSDAVVGIGVQKVVLSATAGISGFQKYSYVVNIPSISGKTIGTGSNDYLNIIFWFDAGSEYNSRTDNLGQQSGTFDIAHVSLVEGDATQEADPFSARHRQQEAALCQRYYIRSTEGALAFSDTTIIGTSADVRTKYAMFPFPVTMRAYPACSVAAGWTATPGLNFMYANKIMRQDTGETNTLWVAEAEL